MKHPDPFRRRAGILDGRRGKQRGESETGQGFGTDERPETDA
jgi:hypothetical protein